MGCDSDSVIASTPNVCTVESSYVYFTTRVGANSYCALICAASTGPYIK